MATRRWVLVLLVLLLTRTPSRAANHQVNCDNGDSLAQALDQVAPGETIQVRGTC
jgi:hypothetical protein